MRTRVIEPYSRAGGIFLPAVLSIMFIVCSAFAAGPGQAIQSIDPFIQRIVNEEGNILRVTVESSSFQDLKSGPEARTVVFPLSRTEKVPLELKRFDVFTSDTKFLLGRSGGDLETSVPDFVAFRGEVAGEQGSHAFIAMAENGMMNGYVTLSKR